MSYGPKAHVKRRAARAMRIVAAAKLAGMEVQRHNTVSNAWRGEGYIVYSTKVDGTQIYRLSQASLARVWLEARARAEHERANGA